MSNALSGALPVGSVLPYVGLDPLALQKKGWLLCRKMDLDRTAYKELFDAIGTASGAPNQETFNLPDYQGYFLRGVNGDGERDPNAADRVAAAKGGNIGNNVGSTQQYATSYPNTPFTSEVEHLSDDRHRAYRGTTVKVSEGNSGSVDVVTTGGGDNETRPKNKYVHFIIKAKSIDDVGEAVDVPVGAIIAFAGPGVPDGDGSLLLECNGDAFNNTGSYAALFDVIRTSQGGDGNPNFCIPDFRGYFLRGVADGQLTDPDRSSRLPPRPEFPEGAQGNAGDEVGSLQPFASALPSGDKPFVTAVPDLPLGEFTSDTCAGRSSTNWNAGAVLVDLTPGGGDTETRPTNVSVSWYIRY